jgi:hypothetical protein
MTALDVVITEMKLESTDPIAGWEPAANFFTAPGLDPRAFA